MKNKGALKTRRRQARCLAFGMLASRRAPAGRLNFLSPPHDQCRRAVALNAGNPALLGTSGSGSGDPCMLVQLFRGELFVRRGRAGEARFDALQTLAPENLQAQIQRNRWYMEAIERAKRGDIVGAVDALATMVSFHGAGGDIDAAMLATCRDLVRRVRVGVVSADVASEAFHTVVLFSPSEIFIQNQPSQVNVF